MPRQEEARIAHALGTAEATARVVNAFIHYEKKWPMKITWAPNDGRPNVNIAFLEGGPRWLALTGRVLVDQKEILIEVTYPLTVPRRAAAAFALKAKAELETWFQKEPR